MSEMCNTIIDTFRDDRYPPPNWWYEVAAGPLEDATVVQTDGFYATSQAAHDAAKEWMEHNPDTFDRLIALTGQHAATESTDGEDSPCRS